MPLLHARRAHQWLPQAPVASTCSLSCLPACNQLILTAYNLASAPRMALPMSHHAQTQLAQGTSSASRTTGPCPTWTARPIPSIAPAMSRYCSPRTFLVSWRNLSSQLPPDFLPFTIQLNHTCTVLARSSRSLLQKSRLHGSPLLRAPCCTKDS